MKYSILILMMLLVGCSTVPVNRKFPDAPKVLFEDCPQLKKVAPEEESLSGLLSTVIENYSTYYQCKSRNDLWQQWYKQQKKVFEEIN